MLPCCCGFWFDLHLCAYCSLNANLDLIVRGTELLSALQLSPAPGKDHAVLDSLGDLQDMFALSHSQCSAAERLMTSPELYKRVVNVAAGLDSKKVGRSS